jgi:membrane protein implicated in regulation of membrane protease activity
MIWWYWMLLGLLLLGAEMMTPGGFYMLFLGVSAMIVGTLTGLDVIGAEWLQWLLFSGIAVAALLLGRRPLAAMMTREASDGPDVNSMAGELAIPLEPLPVGGTGKAELRGSTWTAKNVGPAPLGKGQRGKVTHVEGLTLWITTE